MASTDASPSTASATDGDEVPSLTKGIEQLLLDAEAMPRLAWDTPDVDLKPEDVRKLGFTPEDWSAANTAFKPICLMMSQASKALHKFATHKSKSSSIPPAFLEAQRRTLAPTDKPENWKPVPGKGYMLLSYNGLEEALNCTTCKKEIVWLPCVPGLVQAQGYSGLAEALDRYDPGSEFVLLASINLKQHKEFTRLKAWIIPALGQNLCPKPTTGFVRVMANEGGAAQQQHAVCQGPDCEKVHDLKMCVGCHSAAYCSRSCQRAHWKAGHKRECKRLKAMLAMRGAVAGVPQEAKAPEEAGATSDGTPTAAVAAGAASAPATATATAAAVAASQSSSAEEAAGAASVAGTSAASSEGPTTGAPAK